LINVSQLDEARRLFDNFEGFSYTRGRLDTACQNVDAIPADQLLNTPTEDIVAELVEKHSFTPPTLKRDEEYIDGPYEVKHIRDDFGHQVVQNVTLLGLIIPFDGEGGLFYLNPNRQGHVIFANLYFQNLILVHRGQNLQSEHVNKTFEARIEEIEQMLRFQRDMAEHHRASIPPRVRPLIEDRKNRLLADRKMVSGLAFRIRAREDSAKTYAAPVVRKKVVVQRPPATAPFKPEPVLDEAIYLPFSISSTQ
jgi:hypothetical protein